MDWIRTSVVILPPSAMLPYCVEKVQDLVGPIFFLVGILWVQDFYWRVFRGSQILSSGYFVGPKFFLVVISWLQNVFSLVFCWSKVFSWVFGSVNSKSKSTQLFLCEFCKIFTNTSFTEHLLVTASDISSKCMTQHSDATRLLLSILLFFL